jgi:glycine dehydrogenase subunit 1
VRVKSGPPLQDSVFTLNERSPHPYIPNSVAEVKQEMLKEIGVRSGEELYNQIIPDRLRLKSRMNLPNPLTAEADLKRHVEQILSRDTDCNKNLSFLGAGCWKHYVPAVCDEIAGRAEFLTAYGGDEYSDVGKHQAFFEFQSMMGELVGMDVVGLPTYDWGASAGNAIRMASRITDRKEVLVARTISPNRLGIVRNFCGPMAMPSHIDVKTVNMDLKTGMLDVNDLREKISTKTAGVYFENPSYLGVIEANGQEISKIAHDFGAESIVGIDPISLGVLTPPADYGADIVCGELQSLGKHMFCGGSVAGFLACRDEEKYVGEHPSHLVTITETDRGEYAFAYCMTERTSYVGRDKAKDWVGTAAGLWTIVSAVYLALMGPKGMKELGEAILQKSHYAARKLAQLKGINVPFSNFFKEFVVTFDSKTPISEINKRLLNRGIFGGKDISSEFPELANSGLYCVTETHSKENILRLVEMLKEVSK